MAQNRRERARDCDSSAVTHRSDSRRHARTRRGIIARRIPRTFRHATHQRKINELRPVWHQGLGHGSNTQILLQYQRIRPILAMQKASSGVTTESGMQLWFWGKQTLPPRPFWATTLPSNLHTLSHTSPQLLLARRRLQHRIEQPLRAGRACRLAFWRRLRLPGRAGQ